MFLLLLILLNQATGVFLLTNIPASLLEKLASSEYDKSKTPLHDSGEATNVTVRVIVKKISDVKEYDLSYKIKYDFHMEWKDVRLNWTEPNDVVLDHNWNIGPEMLYSKLWQPRLILHNCDDAHMAGVVSTKIDRFGNVYFNTKIKAVCSCPMDLSRYPLDTQQCPMMIESYAYPANQVSLWWHKDEIDSSVCRISGYSVIDMKQEKKTEQITRGDATDYYDRLVLTFVVRRSFLYFLYHTYIPIIMLMILNMGSYWIPHTAIPARICLIGTTFLTNIFILQGVTEHTVRADVTTSLQVFVLVNIVMVVIALLQYLAVLYMVTESLREKLPLYYYRRQATRDVKPALMRSSKPRNPHPLDSAFRIWAPISYLVFCGIYFGYLLK